MSTETFRLESVQKIRESLRDMRKQELAAAAEQTQIFALELARLEAMTAQIRCERMEKLRETALDLSVLKAFRDREKYLQEQRRKQLENLRQAQAEEDRRRSIYEEAVQDVRVLEKLREKQAVQRLENEKKEEANFLDELTRQKFQRVQAQNPPQ